VLEAQLWHVLSERERKHAMMFAEQKDFDLVEIIKFLRTFKDEKGKPIIRDSRYETIKKNYQPYLEIYNKNKSSENFANWYYEKMLLGYTYNKTLKDIFSEKRPDLLSVREINQRAKGEEVVFVGRVEDCYEGTSKEKKTKYYKTIASDETGSIKVMIFGDRKEECSKMNNGLPEEGNIVIVRGRKMDEVVFADIIGIQDNKVYTKLSEIKRTIEKEKNLQK
jgi:hypothetical protein